MPRVVSASRSRRASCLHHSPSLLALALLTVSCYVSAVGASSSQSVPSTLAKPVNHPANDGPATEHVAVKIDEARGNPSEEWRRSLPSGLRDEKGAPLHRVEMRDDVVLYLLGSSHVSRESCEDARVLMEHVRPDALFVELCSQRVGLMMGDATSDEEEEDGQTRGADDQVVKKSLQERGNNMYAKIQADYAKKLNVTIGGEFREAFQAALSQQCQFWDSRQAHPSGMHTSQFARYIARHRYRYPTAPHPRGNRPCTIILGDRPVRITLQRAWESLRLFGKLKLILALAWSSIRQPSEKELKEFIESILNDRSGKNDLITKAMEDLEKSFPTLKRTIIEERDEYMAVKLMQTADMLHYGPNKDDKKVIVAVVGAGHCAGMLGALKKLTQTEAQEIPIQEVLDLIETKKRQTSFDDRSSLIFDLVQFDYSCLLDSETQSQAKY